MNCLKRLAPLFLVYVALAAGPAVGQSAFSGDLVAVRSDDGTGRYSGGDPAMNDSLSTYFVYPRDCDSGCQVESIAPNETHYSFDVLADSAVATWADKCFLDRSDHFRVEIANDRPADQAMVDLTAALGFPVALGQPLDVMSLSAEADIPGLPNSVEWTVRVVFATENPLDDTTLQPIPVVQPDLQLFELVEFNASSDEVYSAIGTGYVPEPSLLSLLASGCAALAIRVRTRGSRVEAATYRDAERS